MGFEDYFFIVSDLIYFVKIYEVMVGLGCGLLVGLLVSYLLGIIIIDLLKYNFLFERFFNFECVIMLDIDIDFEDMRCEKVIKYV